MSSPDSSANPLFAHGTPPRFEEIGPEHVHEAMPVLLAQTKAALQEFVSVTAGAEDIRHTASLAVRVNECIEEIERSLW